MSTSPLDELAEPRRSASPPTISERTRSSRRRSTACSTTTPARRGCWTSGATLSGIRSMTGWSTTSRRDQ